MKRIIGACLEQTQKFEPDGDYQTYIRGLERKSVKYKIVDKQAGSDNIGTVKIKRDYNNFPAGGYLD
jgi:hypothetical protein